MKPIIEVSHLYKKYKIGEKQRYYSFRDTLVDLAKAPFKQKNKIKNNAFWALKDISFKVMPGEVIGIIGRNGAGKSTLLKILSRITPPTKGEITLRGRVASLLEVGTGFHPELTGRENIYLNGAILGMKRVEINNKFDEIVEFAEISKFLDTPVKFYSSGMYMRLAFAIAAHLEPEILLVDEVLAVGDTQFQKKCLGKMKEVSKQGRTVLFVSHNMNAIEELCTKCLLLEKGGIKKIDTDIRLVIQNYLYSNKKNQEQKDIWINSGKEFENTWFKPIKFYIGDENAKLKTMPIDNNSNNWIYIEIELYKFNPAFTIGYAIYSSDNQLLYWSYQTDIKQVDWPKLTKGYCKLRSKIPKKFLNEGDYRIELIASLHFKEWLCEPGENTPFIYLSIRGGLSDSPYWIMKRPGILGPVFKWENID